MIADFYINMLEKRREFHTLLIMIMGFCLFMQLEYFRKLYFYLFIFFGFVLLVPKL